MVTSDLLVGQAILKVGWRSATTTHGAQYAMTHGELLMLMWPVDSLDSLQLVTMYTQQFECHCRFLNFDCFALELLTIEYA